jgi:hypothetical protein
VSQSSAPIPPTTSFWETLKKFFFGAGALSFLVGGGLIHAETNMSRFNAELVGFGIAAICVLLGTLVGSIGEFMEPRD